MSVNVYYAMLKGWVWYDTLQEICSVYFWYIIYNLTAFTFVTRLETRFVSPINAELSTLQASSLCLSDDDII